MIPISAHSKAAAFQAVLSTMDAGWYAYDFVETAGPYEPERTWARGSAVRGRISPVSADEVPSEFSNDARAIFRFVAAAGEPKLANQDRIGDLNGEVMFEVLGIKYTSAPIAETVYVCARIK